MAYIEPLFDPRLSFQPTSLFSGGSMVQLATLAVIAIGVWILYEVNKELNK